MILPSPSDAVRHLEPATWTHVSRHLVGKALAELAHELLIEPVLLGAEQGWGDYALSTDDPNVEYRFRARVLALEHWWVDRTSIRKLARGQETPVEAEQFVVELRERLGISPLVLPEYLHEVSSTLYAAAYKRFRPAQTASQLARASFQELEAGMTEGHPSFVANNARVGFNAVDYPAYAPEVAPQTRLVWLAARKDLADSASVAGVDCEAFVRAELGAEAVNAFEKQLATLGHDPRSYTFLPVHPWQWENRIQQLFAGDLARGELVHLGLGHERYQPQQSIRTLFNLTSPHKSYVKLALSILNMGFTRGLSPAIATSAAAVNDWVGAVVEGDPYLRECGFSILREIAFVGYRQRQYEKAISRRSDPYKELLAALWRESPIGRLQPGERVMTMAALLHVDRDGASLLTALIAASGASVEDWLGAYLRAYLRPLLHCFYAHNLTFTPHCENVILVLKNDVPVRIFMKDIAEDVGVLNPEQDLPEKVRRLALRVPEQIMTLVIFTDVFDCVFRFLSQILLEHAGLAEDRFWTLVAECIRDYQASHAELEKKFERYDLFAPSFIRNCLNRLQLRNNRLMVDLNAPEPADSLQFAGMLQNPIASLRGREARTSRRGGFHGHA